MEEHEETKQIEDIPPLVMSIQEFNKTVEALFNERFGGYDNTNSLHVRLRRKLHANALISDTDDTMYIMYGEVAQVMRQWLNEHEH